MARKQESRYHRRPDGLLETTQTDNRTGKRIHFYGRSDREIDRQIMEFSAEQNRGRLFKAVVEEWHDLHWLTLAYSTMRSINGHWMSSVANQSVRLNLRTSNGLSQTSHEEIVPKR